MGKYVHSYSALADYQLCPRLFERKHLLKLYPFEETAATRRGNRLHKAMEDYIEGKGEFPTEFEGDRRLVDLLKNSGARAEVKIGITRDGRGCNFFDNDNVWLRGKIDIHKPIIERNVVLMGDWKTGNPRYTDEFQAVVYSALASYSALIEKALFFWGYFSGEMPSKLLRCDESFAEVRRIAEAVEADNEYAPQPCWKCRWCPVTDCQFNTSGG